MNTIFVSGLKRQKGISLVALTIMVALGVGAVLLYNYANQTRDQAIELEQKLGAQYLDNQNYLSTYVSGFYEQVGVANVKSERLETILVEAVKGRYEEKGVPDNGQLFSMLVEAYPDLNGLDIFDQMIPYIQSQREGYKNIQTKLLDQLRSYDTWRKKGIIRNLVLQNFIPSDNLEARVGNQVFRGNDARDKMYQIVLTKSAVEAYESGTMDPLQVPSSNKQ